MTSSVDLGQRSQAPVALEEFVKLSMRVWFGLEQQSAQPSFGGQPTCFLFERSTATDGGENVIL